MINDINFVRYKWPCTFDCHRIVKFEVIVDNHANQADWLGVRARTPAYGREMCAEAKHSAERSPWHCCKNKRIANGVYPPRPRSLRFIYDTTEPNPALLLFLQPPPWPETLHLVLPTDKSESSSGESVRSTEFINVTLKFLFFFFLSLSSFSSFFFSFFPSFCIIVEEIVNQTK